MRIFAPQIAALALGVLLDCQAAEPSAPPLAPPSRAASGEMVVVVHGLQWRRETMKPTADHLASKGYKVARFSYDSRGEKDPQAIAEQLGEWLGRNGAAEASKIHFVCHSMGCIVVRCYLQKQRPKTLGRVIMLAPPNHGTELADILEQSALLRRIFGNAAVSLRSRNGLPDQLPAADYAPGIIMGNRSAVPFISPFIEGPDDGVLAVKSGRLEGMADFVVVPATHTRIAESPDALRQIDCFLQLGRFDHTSHPVAGFKKSALSDWGSQLAGKTAAGGSGKSAPPNGGAGRPVRP